MSDTKKRRRHSPEFKAKVALEAAKGEKTLSQLASEFGVAPVQISQWKRQLLEGATALFERIQTLLADWPIPVYRILDFYHATEHLVEVAKACKGWSAKQRKTWWRKQQRRLTLWAVALFISETIRLRVGSRVIIFTEGAILYSGPETFSPS